MIDDNNGNIFQVDDASEYEEKWISIESLD